MLQKLENVVDGRHRQGESRRKLAPGVASTAGKRACAPRRMGRIVTGRASFSAPEMELAMCDNRFKLLDDSNSSRARRGALGIRLCHSCDLLPSPARSNDFQA